MRTRRRTLELVSLECRRPCSPRVGAGSTSWKRSASLHPPREPCRRPSGSCREPYVISHSQPLYSGTTTGQSAAEDIRHAGKAYSRRIRTRSCTFCKVLVAIKSLLYQRYIDVEYATVCGLKHGLGSPYPGSSRCPRLIACLRVDTFCTSNIQRLQPHD